MALVEGGCMYIMNGAAWHVLIWDDADLRADGAMRLTSVRFVNQSNQQIRYLINASGDVFQVTLNAGQTRNRNVPAAADVWIKITDDRPEILGNLSLQIGGA